MTSSSASVGGPQGFSLVSGAIVRAYRAAWNMDPVWVPLTLMVAGLLIFIASFPLHVAFVSYPLPGGEAKQVGFVPAFNWSLVLPIIFPGAIFMMLVTLRRLNKALEKLAGHHMLAQRDWSPASPAQSAALIDRVWRGATPIGLFFFVLGLLVMGWDWSTSVAGPLFSHHVPLQPGQTDIQYELDWSISALFNEIHSRDPLPSLSGNEIFSTVAYLFMTLETAIILSFYGFLVGVSKEIYALYDQRRELLLTPNVADNDRRRGFEVFEGFFYGVLVATFLGYVACYFMRIQNLYLRDDHYTRLDGMMFQQISNALKSDFAFPAHASFGDIVGYFFRSVGDITGAIFETGNWADTQAYLGAITILIVFLLITAALFAVLRTAAAESRHTLLLALEDRKAKPAIERYYGLPASTIKTKINADKMDIWPLDWPKVNTFSALLCLGFACFIFYRLALIWIALQLWHLVRRHLGSH